MNPTREKFDFINNIAHAWMILPAIWDKGIVRISNGDGDSMDFDFMSHLPEGDPDYTGEQDVHLTKDEGYPMAALIAEGVVRALADDDEIKEML